MKKTSLAVLVSLAALAGVAQAQESDHVRTITDPNEIAKIEQHAQELKDQPQAPMAHEEEHHKAARHERHHHPVMKKHEEKKDDAAK